MNPLALMAALSALKGAGGGPGAGMGGPPMGGPPFGGPPMGGPPMPGPDQGQPGPGAQIPGLDNLTRMGLASLDGMTNLPSRSGVGAIDKIKQGLDVIQQMINAILPQIPARGLNPQVYKDLHVIGRQVADSRLNLEKEPEMGTPPEAFMMGLQGTGVPGGVS